jgi:acetolactate synthase I/III small subunit
MKYTLVAWMRDKPGVLSRVSGMLRRRNFNIDSLQVSHSETPGISRMTFVVDGDERVADQVVKQMNKVVDVTRVEDISDQPTILRELALIRVRTTSATRSEIMQFAEIYRAQIVDISADSLVVQIVGSEDKVDSLIDLLDRFGIEEMVRTGRVALARGMREGSHKAASSVWKARSTPSHNGNRSEREKTGGV